MIECHERRHPAALSYVAVMSDPERATEAYEEHQQNEDKIEDFKALMEQKGRVEAALALLKTGTGSYVRGPEMIAILTGDAPCGAE